MVDQRCIDFWDSVFSQEDSSVPIDGRTGYDALDDAIAWLSGGSRRILDFGCGNGTMLFICARIGTTDHVGIDLSREAILCAQRKAAKMKIGSFLFHQGGVEALSPFSEASFDAIILSNILDNLYPEDAMLLLDECTRILKTGGKVFVKLNPYLSQEQISEWKIKTIVGNLLDDGLLLWNNSTEQWREILTGHFVIEREGEVYYPEHEQTNRLFCLLKP